MNCWICEERIADSREHKLKASDVKRHHGKKFKDKMFLIIGGDELEIDNYKSPDVKFEKVICEICNNERTAPHDNAYDIFAKYILNSYEKLITEKVFDFFDIFGSDWISQKKNLYRYFAKHAGCKIVTGNYDYIVRDLADFIKGNDYTDTFKLHFQLKEGIKIMYDISKNERPNHPFSNISNGKTIAFRDNSEELISFAGWTSYQWISTNWMMSHYLDKSKKVDFNNQFEIIEVKSFFDLPKSMFTPDVSLDTLFLFQNIDNQDYLTDEQLLSFFKNLIY
jgi:hypothetical protein